MTDRRRAGKRGVASASWLRCAVAVGAGVGVWSVGAGASRRDDRAQPEPPSAPGAPAEPAGPAEPVAPDLPPDRPEGLAPSAENAALADEITPELERAVERGLAALVAMQNQDGSFGSGRFEGNVAITSLACLALLADGNLPGRGRYGDQVERGLRHVLDNSTETGLIAAASASGPMYGHGFATLFLGELYGMTQGGPDTDEARRLHDALLRAARLIERSQNPEGGWRYNPVPQDADVSVTIAQIMALRSVRNAGLEVPRSVIDRAVRYVRQCQNPDGGFMYQLPAGVSLWPRSAAGVAALYYAGIYQDNAIERGLGYLGVFAQPGSALRGESHYWYGQYYTAQAMYLAGGDHWAAFWPLVRAELLGRQNADVAWSDPTVGRAYATAMALIVLQMPKRYLPIFQK